MLESKKKLSVESRIRKNITIGDFLEKAKQLDKKKLLEHALEFSFILDQEEDFAEHLFIKEQDWKKAFQQIVKYYHPDKYSLHYSDILPNQEESLCSTFRKLVSAKAKLIEREGASPEEIKTFVSEIFEVDPSKEGRIRCLTQIEKDCYNKIISHGNDLHENIVISLLRIYGQAVSYLINWAAENDLNWLISEGNMEQLGKNLSVLMPYVEKFGLVEEFDRALQISSVISKSAEPKRILYQQKEQVIERNKTEKRKEKNSILKDGGKTFVSIAIGIGVTAALASNPVGWGIAAASSVLLLGSFIASVAHKKSKAQDRLDYYEQMFKNVVENHKKIDAVVKEHINYMTNVSIGLANTRLIQASIKSEMQEDLLILRSLDRNRTDSEDERLKSLEEECGTQKQIEFKPSFFSEAEKRILSVMITEDLDNLSPERAKELREDYFSDDITEEELQLMEETNKNSILPNQQPLLKAEQQRFLLFEPPSTTVTTTKTFPSTSTSSSSLSLSTVQKQTEGAGVPDPFAPMRKETEVVREKIFKRESNIKSNSFFASKPSASSSKMSPTQKLDSQKPGIFYPS